MQWLLLQYHGMGSMCHGPICSARSRTARHTRVRYDKVRLAVNCRLGAARCLVLSSAHSSGTRVTPSTFRFAFALQTAQRRAAASVALPAGRSTNLIMGRDFASHAGEAATIAEGRWEGLGFFSRGDRPIFGSPDVSLPPAERGLMHILTARVILEEEGPRPQIACGAWSAGALII